MTKREGIYEGLLRPIMLTVKIFIPPFYSLRRLEAACKAWIKDKPDASYPRSFLADLYRFYNKNEEAKQEYLELKRLGAIKNSDLIGLGEISFRLEDYHGVIENIYPIIDKYPKHKNANWYLGRSFMKTGEFQKAAIFLEKVISLGSKRYEDYWNLGYCYDRTGILEKARKYYSNALSLKPDSQELKQNVAAIDNKMQIRNVKNN